MRHTFYSNGKLLITGEYAVLDGARALALPTRYGQSLMVETLSEKEIHWQSLDQNGQSWFKNTFYFVGDRLKSDRKDNQSQILLDILEQAREMNPTFLTGDAGFYVTTLLDFPRSWGLGTSSTLINNIALWAKIDAFTLLQKSFGGSGYDIAAAQRTAPFLYSILKDKPIIEEVVFPLHIAEKLFFVHLNRKQDSKEGIERYRSYGASERQLEEISAISLAILKCKSLHAFEELIELHEKLISQIIKTPTVKEKLFPDFNKSVKSLGAWGGDFVLVTGDASHFDYFRRKGYETIIPFNEMIP